MAKKIRSTGSKKIGLPPGALVYTGEKKNFAPKSVYISYNENFFLDKKWNKVENDQFYWMSAIGVHDPDSIREIGSKYKIHQLILEDVLNVDQRIKIDINEDNFFALLKWNKWDAEAELQSIQIGIYLKDNILITFQETEEDLFKHIRERLSKDIDTRKKGSKFLFYSLLDSIIDNYFVLIDQAHERVYKLEESIILLEAIEGFKKIQQYKVDIINLQRQSKSLTDLTKILLTRSLNNQDSELTPFYRDLFDHAHQVSESLMYIGDKLNHLRENIISVSNFKTNNVMKTLTVVATIFMPLTFISSIYGMNFKFMPELEWHYGYFVVLAVMLIVGVGMGIYIKRRNWL